MRGANGIRTAVLGLLALAMAGACAEGQAGGPRGGSPASAPKPSGQNASIDLDADVDKLGEGVSAAWLAYGVAKAGAYEEHPPPKANTSGDDFAIELAARQAQSQVWAEVRRDPKTAANADLDKQLEISKAGFLPELVVAIHSSAGWTVPRETVASLRLEAFAKRFSGRFSRARYSNFTPSGGTPVPPVPGGDFPDPASLPYGAASCGRAVEARRTAWRAWAALEPQLGGAPISAATPPDFARQLIALQRDPAAAARGATWVSERVGYLAQLEGFCAVEARDWARAETLLKRSVALWPANASPRLELSLVYSKQGRHRDALTEADRALVASGDDACSAARAWRRRGYVLIDLGNNTAARQAYEKSLVIDPGNPIALRELEVIARNNAAPKDSVIVPAAPNDVLVTTCRSQDLPARGAPATP
jgi:hypothetical protein